MIRGFFRNDYTTTSYGNGRLNVEGLTLLAALIQCIRQINSKNHKYIELCSFSRSLHIRRFTLQHRPAIGRRTRLGNRE
ncbi:hypothetical protein V6Z11_D07G129100 [Gossypium hirsutum]